MSAAINPFKKHFKSLVFEIHPDYFVKYPTIQRTNEAAIHTLKSIFELPLNSTKNFITYSSALDIRKVEKTVLSHQVKSVTFYCKSYFSDESLPIKAPLKLDDFDLNYSLKTIAVSNKNAFIQRYLFALLLRICNSASVPVDAEEENLCIKELQSFLSVDRKPVETQAQAIRKQFLEGLKKNLFSSKDSFLEHKVKTETGLKKREKEFFISLRRRS